MVNNNSEFLLNAALLRQVIYISLIIGNFLFIMLHPTDFRISVVHALSVVL